MRSYDISFSKHRFTHQSRKNVQTLQHSGQLSEPHDWIVIQPGAGYLKRYLLQEIHFFS